VHSQCSPRIFLNHVKEIRAKLFFVFLKNNIHLRSKELKKKKILKKHLSLPKSVCMCERELGLGKCKTCWIRCLPKM
jgi:hypothetical protein